MDVFPATAQQGKVPEFEDLEEGTVGEVGKVHQRITGPCQLGKDK